MWMFRFIVGDPIKVVETDCRTFTLTYNFIPTTCTSYNYSLGVAGEGRNYQIWELSSLQVQKLVR